RPRDTLSLLFYFFNTSSPSEIYTLSLHDALPIFYGPSPERIPCETVPFTFLGTGRSPREIDADLASSVNSTPAQRPDGGCAHARSEELTSELQSRGHLVCRLLLEKKKITMSKLNM